MLCIFNGSIDRKKDNAEVINLIVIDDILKLLNRMYNKKVVPGDGLEPSHSKSEGF